MVKAVLKRQKRHIKPQWDTMLPLLQQLLKNSSWIDFFFKHTLNNYQDLLWKETQGKKGLQSWCWFVWESSWDLAAVFHCWQCSQSCTFAAFRRQEHDSGWVLPCRDVTSGTTSPTWMWHPPTPLLFPSAFFQWHKDLTKPLGEFCVQGE